LNSSWPRLTVKCTNKKDQRAVTINDFSSITYQFEEAVKSFNIQDEFSVCQKLITFYNININHKPRHKLSCTRR
jgi:hypothetical protein